MKLHLLLEDDIEDKLEQLLKLQAYVGEYNVPCEVELVGDELIALMHSGTQYIINDNLLASLQSAEQAYLYAQTISRLRGKFELGEPIIATDANRSYYYARDVIKRRFELGERAIATDANFTYLYARDVIKGKFELGERVIAKDAYWAYRYACNVIKRRFELGEPEILKSEHANDYEKLFLRLGQ
jgi:hypothetical protein